MLFLCSILGGDDLTKFEKALISELKGIRKELQNMNKKETIEIKTQPLTANDILAEKITELKGELQKEEFKNTEYDPLGVPLSRR